MSHSPNEDRSREDLLLDAEEDVVVHVQKIGVEESQNRHVHKGVTTLGQTSTEVTSSLEGSARRDKASVNSEEEPEEEPQDAGESSARARDEGASSACAQSGSIQCGCELCTSRCAR